MHDGTNRTPNTIWNTNCIGNTDWLTTDDPCALELGSGWRIPTQTEWINVAANGNWTNWDGPWNSGLRLHAAGSLNENTGVLEGRGVEGYYWSNSKGGTNGGYDFALAFLFREDDCFVGYEFLRRFGFSLRCLRE